MTEDPSRIAAKSAFVEHRQARPSAEFDYDAEAELFPMRKRVPRRQPLGYRRFAHAAHAIQFAIEGLPPELLVGAYLEVDEQRYNSDEIRRLYDRADYPLTRAGVSS
jgi:hypothetical protein